MTVRRIRVARSWPWPYRAGLVLVLLHIGSMPAGTGGTGNAFGVGILLMTAALVGPTVTTGLRLAWESYRDDGRSRANDSRGIRLSDDARESIAGRLDDESEVTITADQIVAGDKVCVDATTHQWQTLLDFVQHELAMYEDAHDTGLVDEVDAVCDAIADALSDGNGGDG